MSGTSEGAQKARDKNLAKDPNFYRNIGKRSWTNPNRSHETGFAKLSREKHIELSRKGGKKTKDDYQETEYETAESLREIFHPEDEEDKAGLSTSLSE